MIKFLNKRIPDNERKIISQMINELDFENQIYMNIMGECDDIPDIDLNIIAFKIDDNIYIQQLNI